MFRIKQISVAIAGFVAVIVMALVVFSSSAISGDTAALTDTFLPIVAKPVPQLPDLTVPFVKITLQNNPPCYSGQPLGTEALIENIGLAGAGAFVVNINGTPAAVNGLPVAASQKVWVAGYKSGQSTFVFADSTNVIAELNENNNVFNGFLPVPTAPAPCPTVTPLPTQPPSPTATPIATQPPNIICSYNAYNCPDFSTQAEAQYVFDYCYQQVGFDVHRLDADNDGIACENLP